MFGWEKVDRNDDYYKACLVGTTAIGAVSGLLTGAPTGPGAVVTTAAGGVLGFTVGYLACPYLAPQIRKKIEGGLALNEGEIKSAAHAMSRYAGVSKAGDAVKLLAVTRSQRHASSGNPSAASSSKLPATKSKSTSTVTAQSRGTGHHLTNLPAARKA